MAMNMKSPPYSVHAEKALLGAMVVDPALTGSVTEIIRGADVFFREQYSRLYATMLKLYADGGTFDRAGLMAAMARSGTVAETDLRVTLDQLVAAAAPPAAALEHARQIQDKALLRRYIDVVSDLLREATLTDDSFQTIVARARARLDELAAQGR